MPRKKSPPDPEYLVATIDKIERTYFVSQEHEHGFLDDEAIVDVTGTIEDISARHARFLGQPIAMTFACARRFKKDADHAENEPVLFPMNLRKTGCSFMAYLPADAFWTLPSMIDSEAVTCIEARFASVRYGSGELLSVYFATRSKLHELALLLAPRR
jgi:hypothetical protein